MERGCALQNHPQVVQLLSVEKIYQSGPIRVPAVRGIDLEVKRGEFVALAGPSGCGKSTLLNLMGCLDRPTKGKVLLEGRDVTTLSDEELAHVRNRKVGFIFQMYNLLPSMDVRRNVELPLAYARVPEAERKARVKKVLEEVHLSDRARHRPTELSGGERQRVAIARALVVEPLLLLADEPTGNLDSASGKEIMEIFRALNRKGATIFLVSHDPDVASYAGRVFRMRDGKLIV